MATDPLTNVRAGLRKLTRFLAVYLFGIIAALFGVFYWESTIYPALPAWWPFLYLALAVSSTSAFLWYQAHRTNPRLVAFVEGLSRRLTDATFIPYGRRARGVFAKFDNRLILTTQASVLAFRLFFEADGTVLRPTLEGLPTLLWSYRGAKRRGLASSRRGDAWIRAEVEKVLGLLSARSWSVSLYERVSNGAHSSTARWEAVGLFFTPKWAQRAGAVAAAADDLEELLERARTVLATG